MKQVIYPNWPAPQNVFSLTTTRLGGVSLPPYDSFNLGAHVKDNPIHVKNNRSLLIKQYNLPSEPFWLNQVHSPKAVNIDLAQKGRLIDADASYSCCARQVSVVLTADCLPILFCSKNGDEIASAHAGWRGLCHGVIENTVKQFKASRQDILVWLGPAIGPNVFEVGIDVKTEFEQQDKDYGCAFTLISEVNHKYLADLYLLAKLRLQKLGITSIYGGEYCTYSQNSLFYSYRRENQTGRMASLIWFE